MQSPIRVLLADDHPVVRSGIRNLLDKEPDIDVIGEASDGDQVLAMVRSLSPDVLLLDMEMPGRKGYEVVEELFEEEYPVYILVLSAHTDKHYIQTLLGTGVSGYLTKEEVPDVIVDAVRGVARGERGWVSRQVAAQLSGLIQSENLARSELTGREREVLGGVADGKSTKEIAQDLHISEKTVEKHLNSIFTKLGVASRVEAVVHAMRAGWIK